MRFLSFRIFSVPIILVQVHLGNLLIVDLRVLILLDVINLFL